MLASISTIYAIVLLKNCTIFVDISVETCNCSISFGLISKIYIHMLILLRKISKDNLERSSSGGEEIQWRSLSLEIP